jgi:predicted RecB family nuclease
MNPAQEKRAFERFIERVMERRRLYADMHIYHYGSYEETAIKRMAGQHSTCVDEVDELLRGDVLVDMLRAVRQGLRASVESYSIKKLEPFYEYKRDVKLIDANRALQAFQTVFAFGAGEENLDDIGPKGTPLSGRPCKGEVKKLFEETKSCGMKGFEQNLFRRSSGNCIVR